MHWLQWPNKSLYLTFVFFPFRRDFAWQSRDNVEYVEKHESFVGEIVPLVFLLLKGERFTKPAREPQCETAPPFPFPVFSCLDP